MEVSVRQTLAIDRSSSNSFDCDSSALDTVLGLNPKSERQLRVDRAEAVTRLHFGKQPAQLYAPLEVVQASPTQSVRGSIPSGPYLLADAEFKRERLVRLLDRQQAWYDAQQQAARAAEQLLTLCEHHQQQWLLPNQPTLTSPHRQ